MPDPNSVDDNPPETLEVQGHIEIRRAGDPSVRRVALGGSHLIIGRNPNAQIVLDHSTVSRSHAELVHDPFGRWWIHDLGSTNGTYVNGRVVVEQMLGGGDSIGIGEFTLRLDLGPGRSLPDSIFPLPAEDDDVEDTDNTIVTLVAGADRAQHVNATHLRKVLAMGRRLLELEDPADRLRETCEFLVGSDFPGVVAVAIRLRSSGSPKIVGGPFYRSLDAARAGRHVSRGVLKAVWETREPVLASNTDVGMGVHTANGVRRLSTPSMVRLFSVVACPIESADDKLDVLYVELPSTHGTTEWLTLVSLVNDQYQQANLVWTMRRHVRATAYVERELQMARQIQEGLVPKLVRVPGLDIAVGFEPCRWVGGDYVDAVPMPDGRLLLAVADVCGKGLQAALVASSLHTMVRATVEAGGSLVQLVQRVNTYFCSYLPEHSFVTMVCVAIDPETGQMDCVNAGHPPGFAVGRDGNVRWLQSHQNVALGITQEEVKMDRSVLIGDEILVLYTDGLTEVVDEDGRLLGQDRLAAAVAQIVKERPDDTVDDIRHAVFELLASYRGSQIAADDSTFLVARRPRDHKSRLPGGP
jgi:sigma-B regulation protein RsbU (phosphoserine phosphatase)